MVYEFSKRVGTVVGQLLFKRFITDKKVERNDHFLAY